MHPRERAAWVACHVVFPSVFLGRGKVRERLWDTLALLSEWIMNCILAGQGVQEPESDALSQAQWVFTNSPSQMEDLGWRQTAFVYERIMPSEAGTKGKWSVKKKKKRQP